MSGSGSDGKDGCLWVGINVPVVRKHALVDKSAHSGMGIACWGCWFRRYQEDVDGACLMFGTGKRKRGVQMPLIASSESLCGCNGLSHR